MLLKKERVYRLAEMGEERERSFIKGLQSLALQKAITDRIAKTIDSFAEIGEQLGVSVEVVRGLSNRNKLRNKFVTDGVRGGIIVGKLGIPLNPLPDERRCEIIANNQQGIEQFSAMFEGQESKAADGFIKRKVWEGLGRYEESICSEVHFCLLVAKRAAYDFARTILRENKTSRKDVQFDEQKMTVLLRREK